MPRLHSKIFVKRQTSNHLFSWVIFCTMLTHRIKRAGMKSLVWLLTIFISKSQFYLIKRY